MPFLLVNMQQLLELYFAIYVILYSLQTDKTWSVFPTFGFQSI